MRTFVRESKLSMISVGWGNGYVVIPAGHPAHGQNYDDIDVDVHGGLTFAALADDLDWPEILPEDKGGWVVGFDTAHYNDNPGNWPQSKVEAETQSLMQQLQEKN